MYNMDIKSRIDQTLSDASGTLCSVDDSIYIIGAAAIFLLGGKIEETHDIDILTSTRNARLLQSLWAERRVNDFTPPDGDRFKSIFARYKFNLMDIEVMGDLEILIEGSWERLRVDDYHQIKVGDLEVRIPTKEEQIRILKIFGRAKDLAKIDIVKGIH